jgi:hypothetical protein
MRNSKLIRNNRTFMWVNIILGIVVIAVVALFMYFCGYSIF